MDKLELEEGVATKSSILSFQNIRYIRIAKGISQHKLALLSGLDRREISFYETGRRAPKLEALIKIAEALEVGSTSLKIIDINGEESNIETICAIEIPNMDRKTSYIYRKIRDGFIISKRRKNGS